MRWLALALLLLSGGVLAGRASAQESFPPLQADRFSVDLSIGTVLGSIRTIGMGGASVAMVHMASGMGANPAAPAVRVESSNKKWDWDATLDWLNPDIGDDFDNNGQNDGGDTAAVVTLGATLEVNEWGFGADLTIATRQVEDLEITTLIARLLVAASFLDRQLSVGIGLRGGFFEVTPSFIPEPLVSAAGWSGTAGVLWKPAWIDLRLGGSISLPMEVEVPPCPGDCGGLTRPRAIQLPGELAVGAAWRFGPSRWNRQIQEKFRDERALTVAADIVLIGSMGDAVGIQRFASNEGQPSGRSVAVSLRAGAELEAIPGWLRVRGGGYWEPGRLEGTGGRMHGTGGLEVRLFAFHLWGGHFRVRIGLTLDAAREYLNGGLSVGLW